MAFASSVVSNHGIILPPDHQTCRAPLLTEGRRVGLTPLCCYTTDSLAGVREVLEYLPHSYQVSILIPGSQPACNLRTTPEAWQGLSCFGRTSLFDTWLLEFGWLTPTPLKSITHRGRHSRKSDKDVRSPATYRSSPLGVPAFFVVF